MLSRLCRQPSTTITSSLTSTSRLLTRLQKTPSSSLFQALTRSIIIQSPYKFTQPPNVSFADLMLKRIWRHGSNNPEQPAMINAMNPEHRLTFKELYLQSLSVATFLHRQNFHHGHVVATVLPNVIEFPSIVLGAGLLGGATTPAGFLLTAKELEVQFNDSKASIVFCADIVLEKVLEAVKNCPKVKKVVCLRTGLSPDGSRDLALPKECIDFEKVKAVQPETHWSQIEVNPDRDIFLLPYSSGTTGPPKGVMLTNKNMNMMIPNFSNFAAQEVYPFINKLKPVTAQDPQQIFLPFNHSFGMGMLLCNLFTGIPTVSITKFNFELVCQMVQDYKIRVMYAVPPALLLLAKHATVDKYDMSSLEYILAGAAPVSKELMEAVRQRLPNLIGIQQGYGMTEVFISHANTPKENHPYDAVGKLLPGFEMKIVNPETNEELGLNEHGEICLKSPQIMLGYFDKPQSTAAMKDDEGWLHTGDIGYVDDQGYTYIVDRIKELIKVKGLQVAPAELEALLITHPKIKDAAVIGVPDIHNGEVPKAFVVADPSLTPDEVKAFVAEAAAPYKQLKGGVEFLTEIPKSPSGKILRRELRDKENAKM